MARAKRQLRARLVFDTDSVTNIAHQIGYFETVTGPGYFEASPRASREVTPAQVADVARAGSRAESERSAGSGLRWMARDREAVTHGDERPVAGSRRARRTAPW